MNNSDRNGPIFLGMLMIAIALVAAAAVISGAMVKVKRSGNTLTVTGSAKKSIVSDHVVWRGSVSRRSDDMTAAYNAVKQDSDRVRRFFSEKGVADTAVKFNPISSSHMSYYDTLPDGNQITRWYWQMTQSFEVSGPDVDGITAISQEITDLIGEGIGLQSYSPEYLYTKLADMRIEMLGEATADARARAETIVGNAGGKLGPLSSARMGVFQITARHSTDISDYGMYDTSSLEKDITAVVSLTFAVD